MLAKRFVENNPLLLDIRVLTATLARLYFWHYSWKSKINVNMLEQTRHKNCFCHVVCWETFPANLQKLFRKLKIFF